ncbi:disulfide bond formation protein [Novosphingobium sp. Rr 2-17]|uniref:disulfide bond formation protein B n=1 Tax=Novosphingobium sp. Rr 2-17 TaxID=555793 RepID=UPI0002697BBE|nr:disulfide bond formation protein B [Novosphingobium sp. Rr 2-17]EIZ77647.1 disulfide bond formation protein [Novosphingobium sp. Rr 2-17]
MAVSVASPVRAARWLALLIPVGLLGGALISQFGFGLFPCEMCWWQRYPHMLAILLALLAFFWRPVRPLVAVAALAILTSGMIGGFHAGVEYGWWHGFTACTASTLTPGSDPLAAIMNAPVIRCDVAPWDLFGISLAGWNFLFSVGGALAILFLISRRTPTKGTFQ